MGRRPALCPDPACALTLRRYSAGSEAHILWGAGLRAPGEAAELQARLEAAGLPTMDVSAVEAAQVRPQWRRTLLFFDLGAQM